ncbi:hypothetical protein PoB_000790600 [Plakobranchus ocellatus]|uniref:Uncharacterized protein n=1 Tax=Plakobranchus ocellatus TaxID=259542 RepID=A0AAV3YGB2_9GAST|nr:hypothetical protein PoB_000790600 [Plakobranchus ocellatus]
MLSKPLGVLRRSYCPPYRKSSRFFSLLTGGVGGTMASDSALRSDLQGPFCRGFEPRHRRPKSLRSPCCGLTIYEISLLTRNKVKFNDQLVTRFLRT